MRKRNVKQELTKYPCFEFKNGRLVRIPPPLYWHGVELHHYITTQWEQEHPEEFLQVEYLQKLIFLPVQMHKELHAKHSRFKEKYGIEIKELLFDWREYMFNANKAREKSDENSIKILRTDIKKSIDKAVEKGRHYMVWTGEVPQVIIDEIKAGGFDVQVNPTGIKVMW